MVINWIMVVDGWWFPRLLLLLFVTFVFLPPLYSTKDEKLIASISVRAGRWGFKCESGLCNFIGTSSIVWKLGLL